jgi:hypothetical protein
MENETRENPPAREEQRTDAAPIRPGKAPSVIRVGLARIPAFSLTRSRRWPGT